MTAPSPPFTSLFETRPKLAAIKFGLLLGVLKVLVALILFWLLAFIPEEYRGKSAASGLLNAPAFFVLFVAMVFAPVWETIPGQILPIEIARRLGARWWLCVITSVFVFGIGYFMNGGPAHGAATFVLGLFLAYGYTAARTYGFWPAVITTVAAHAFHNAVLLLVVAPLWPV